MLEEGTSAACGAGERLLRLPLYSLCILFLCLVLFQVVGGQLSTQPSGRVCFREEGEQMDERERSQPWHQSPVR